MGIQNMSNEKTPGAFSLAANRKEENMNLVSVVLLLMGTALCAVMILGARWSAYSYVGLVGVLTGAMWMPYLIAIIWVNGIPPHGDSHLDGLLKKLGYVPLTAPLPPWVKRAIVNHNNSMENFMLFGLSVFSSTLMGVAEKDIRTAAILYFCFRVYYTIFTIIPEIFMAKTACWCMGWGCCTYIFLKGLAEAEAVYDL